MGVNRLSGVISVVVSTYNWPEALAVVLYGLANQTDRNFEVVVADDGSDHRTADVVSNARLRAKHVWHEDRGFRLAEIRNRATLACKGEYVIFLDGDCIPRPSFVATHRRLAEPGCFVQGNRVNLRKKLTERVLAEKVDPSKWGPLTWIGHRLGKRMGRLAPLVTLPLGPLRKLTEQTGERALGCNQAFWRKDLIIVDGFDSAFVGWGWEDSDLLARLLHAGVKRKYGNFATGVIHLFHEPPSAHENRRLLDETLATARIQARKGMSTLVGGEGSIQPSEPTGDDDRPYAASVLVPGRRQAATSDTPT
jgi:glycosyltransferase involved in cell wall biosynthesis